MFTPQFQTFQNANYLFSVFGLYRRPPIQHLSRANKSVMVYSLLRFRLPARIHTSSIGQVSQQNKASMWTYKSPRSTVVGFNQIDFFTKFYRAMAPYGSPTYISARNLSTAKKVLLLV